MNSGLRHLSVLAGLLLAPSLLKEGTRAHTLSPHYSSLRRDSLAPTTSGICIKKLVNRYFFLVLDITALDGFQISSPTSCVLWQLIAQKAARHRQRGLAGQRTKLLGFGNAGSLLPSSPHGSSLFIAATWHRAAWNCLSSATATLPSTCFTQEKVASGNAGGYLCDTQKVHIVLKRPQSLGLAA